MHELNAKVEAQAASVTAANDAVDDHAKRLDMSWGLLLRLDKNVGVITTEIQSNDKSIKQTFDDNDTKLKKDLCELESTVSAHTAAIPARWNSVQGAITQVTELIARGPSG